MESGPKGVPRPLYVNRRGVLNSSGSLKEAGVKVQEEPKKVTVIQLWKHTWWYKDDKLVVRCPESISDWNINKN